MALHAVIAVLAFVAGMGVMGMAAVASRADERAAFAAELLRRAEVERRLRDMVVRASLAPITDRSGDA